MSNLDKAKELQARTKTFAIQIIRFYSTLPPSDAARIIGRQLLRSGTSMATNYRAVAARNHELTSFRKWEPLLRKLMKLCFGSNC